MRRNRGEGGSGISCLGLVALLIVGAVFLFFLVEAVRAEESATFWLAKAVAGEVGVMGEHREEAGSWVVHVALNRVGSSWFPDNIIDVVRDPGGFVGSHTVEEPPEWAYQIVYDTLASREEGEDPTEGSLFLFGGQDLTPCMNMSYRQGFLKREGYVFSVHLFTRWPFTTQCIPIPQLQR